MDFKVTTNAGNFFIHPMKNHHFQFQNRLIKLYLPGVFGCPAEPMLKFRRTTCSYSGGQRAHIPADFGARPQREVEKALPPDLEPEKRPAPEPEKPAPQPERVQEIETDKSRGMDL